MTSIRQKLTVWYTVALGATVLAFGAALYFERRQSSERELDHRLDVQANLAVNYLTESHGVLGRIVTEGPRPALISQVGGYFDGGSDYLIVFDSSGAVLSSNDAARQLTYADLSMLYRLAEHPPAQRLAGTLELQAGQSSVRYVVAPVPGVWQTPGAVVVAVPTDVAALAPEQLLRAMLAIGPVILAGSVLVGYLLADRSLRPVEGMMDELEAITDGRSLHRRVMVPPSADELARLAATVNGMIARLEQSFASLHRFTADASHELKTPLMVLRAGVERALTHPTATPEALETLDETLEQINQMTELVENLLTLARADEGRAILAVEPCDLRELVAEASETAGILGEEPGITVRTELPGEPVQLSVDRSRIRQLLLNLITNAIKYTPRGGKVSLALVDQGPAVSLIVGDTGIGIAGGDLPQIFDRFWRADVARSRTGDRPGTGLGLAITKWIAEAHGGSITVQSRPGRGTVFSVSLPRRGEAVEDRRRAGVVPREVSTA